MKYEDATDEVKVFVLLLTLFLYPWLAQLVWNNYLVVLCHFGAISYWQSFWSCLVLRLVAKGVDA